MPRQELETEKAAPGVTPNSFFMRLPVTGSVDVK
jgi:hypothetical protein